MYVSHLSVYTLPLRSWLARPGGARAHLMRWQSLAFYSKRAATTSTPLPHWLRGRARCVAPRASADVASAAWSGRALAVGVKKDLGGLDVRSCIIVCSSLCGLTHPPSIYIHLASGPGWRVWRACARLRGARTHLVRWDEGPARRRMHCRPPRLRLDRAQRASDGDFLNNMNAQHLG